MQMGSFVGSPATKARLLGKLAPPLPSESVKELLVIIYIIIRQKKV